MIEAHKRDGHKSQAVHLRLGYEHRLAPGKSSVEITHRIYLRGLMSGFWSLMMGRKRLRESVVRFIERERELTEPKAARRKRKRS